MSKADKDIKLFKEIFWFILRSNRKKSKREFRNLATYAEYFST
jgi:hypothetical protein